MVSQGKNTRRGLRRQTMRAARETMQVSKKVTNMTQTLLGMLVYAWEEKEGRTRSLTRKRFLKMLSKGSVRGALPGRWAKGRTLL